MKMESRLPNVLKLPTMRTSGELCVLSVEKAPMRSCARPRVHSRSSEVRFFSTELGDSVN